MYKVIFNQDEKNYEEFENLEAAEKFAKNYANTEIKTKENKMKYTGEFGEEIEIDTEENIRANDLYYAKEFEKQKGENKMKYYKIYTKDTQNRDTIRLLETEKSLSEIQKKYSKCEELFEKEYTEMKEHVKMLNF